MIRHETGHAFDYKVLNVCSKKESFKKIVMEESGKFSALPGIHGSHLYYEEFPTEYFAETFDYYFYNSERLKTRCPKTHNFIKKAIESLDNSNFVNTLRALKV